MSLFKKSKKESSCCSCGAIEKIPVTDNQELSENTCKYAGTDENKTSDTKSQIAETGSACGLTIKILGSGCKNCITLTDNVHAALEKMALKANIIKVTDFAEITAYGIMSTPALVVNEKVVSYGKVLKPLEVEKILEKEAYQ